jgi:hypothetical protein
MPSHSFFCSLCKSEKTTQNKNKIILYDIQNDNFFEDSICQSCILQLSLIMRYTTIPKEKKQLALDKWSLKI